MATKSRFKAYYELAKPGIIYGNAVTAIAGFLFAEAGHFNLALFVAMLLGISLVMGSACVFNNYIDRDIDQVMARTKKRALVTGDISTRNALRFGTLLGVAGVVLLARYTNLLTAAIGIIGFFVYVVIYGAWKRRSVHGTLIGSIAGAVPPVVGYCAVTGHFNVTALVLFLIVAIWQMPHFYAIALYRFNDYSAASIPVLPAVKGHAATKKYILSYVLAFLFVALSLSAFGATGLVYAVVMGLISLYWLWLGLWKLKPLSDPLWGRHMFRFSLVIIVVFSLMISIDHFLP